MKSVFSLQEELSSKPSIMSESVKEFNEYREQMNERMMATDNLVIKRFFNLDTQTFSDGALPSKTKEMLGLAASMVLRCDDCIKYHVLKCHEVGITKAEIMEIFSIGLVIGGSIVIPHSRRALEFLEELESNDK